MKKLIEEILKKISKLILFRQKPLVVGITGSVGKTSTKEAVYFALKDSFRVRRNIKSYNNEFGLPLTIIGSKSGGRSPAKWLVIFLRGFLLLLFKSKTYPEVLVLEMGADKIGDLKYLLEAIPSKLFRIFILTAIAPVHLEAFKMIDNILKEKTYPLKIIPKDSFVLINAENCPVEEIKEMFPDRKITLFGFNRSGKIKREIITFHQPIFTDKGIGVKLDFNQKEFSYNLTNSLSSQQLYPVMAAIIVGIFLSVPLEKILEGLKSYTSPKGRLKLIKGVNESLLLDDSYNSSPLALKSAIRALSDYPNKGRKIAVLGDMLELGEKEKNFHLSSGKLIADEKIDFLFTFGKLAKYFAEGAKKQGMDQSKIFIFKNKDKLIDELKKIIGGNDLILIKGSQGARMEQITKRVMANPERAPKLLVRQEKEWIKKN